MVMPVFAVVFFAAAFFAARAAFFIDTVSIDGALAVSKISVLKRIGIPAAGGKTWLLPGVAGVLREDRWIDDVSVHRDFKGGIVIKVKEKKPFCLFVSQGGNLFYVDSSGGVLGPAPVASYGMDFPILRAPTELIADGLLALDLSLSAASTLSWKDISEVVVSHDSFEIFTRKGARMDLDGKDLKGQWRKLEKINHSLYALGFKAKYINLRRQGVGIIGLKEN